MIRRPPDDPLEVSGIFESLVPPRDGVARLRARLDRSERRRRRGRAIVAGVAATMMAIGLLTVTPRRDPASPPDSGDDWHMARIDLGLVAPPREPVTVVPGRRSDQAVLRVATGDPAVVYYRVARLADPRP